MNKEQVLEQLKDLRHSQELFISNWRTEEENEIFKRDIQALDYAIKDIEILESIRTYCEIVFKDEENEPITRKDLEHIYDMIEKRVSKYE